MLTKLFTRLLKMGSALSQRSRERIQGSVNLGERTVISLFSQTSNRNLAFLLIVNIGNKPQEC